MLWLYNIYDLFLSPKIRIPNQDPEDLWIRFRIRHTALLYCMSGMGLTTFCLMAGLLKFARKDSAGSQTMMRGRILAQVCIIIIESSVVHPDPNWFRIQETLWIRIHTREKKTNWRQKDQFTNSETQLNKNFFLLHYFLVIFFKDAFFKEKVYPPKLL